MKEELKIRICALESKKIPSINARSLRGDMQKRLHRQESIRYGNEIRNKIKAYKAKLSMIEKEKEGFSVSSNNKVPLDNFSEPVFNRIRNSRGIFKNE